MTGCDWVTAPGLGVHRLLSTRGEDCVRVPGAVERLRDARVASVRKVTVFQRDCLGTATPAARSFASTARFKRVMEGAWSSRWWLTMA